MTLFFMEITAYTVKGCFYCDQLKILLKRANLECNFVLIEEGQQKRDFKIKYPNSRGFPHVIVDGEELGGLVNTAKYLVKNGHISSQNEHK
tara:strand:+ start:458 stop:730 length:273 start_codon:yes stop_codon:yes gene_type:complete